MPRDKVCVVAGLCCPRWPFLSEYVLAQPEAIAARLAVFDRAGVVHVMLELFSGPVATVTLMLISHYRYIIVHAGYVETRIYRILIFSHNIQANTLIGGVFGNGLVDQPVFRFQCILQPFILAGNENDWLDWRDELGIITRVLPHH